MLELELKDVSQTLVFAMSGTGQDPAWLSFVPFAMVLAILYFLILMPMQKQRKKVQEFQSGLKVGDILTSVDGQPADITRVNDNSVQLQIADNPKVRIEMARAAVGGYQGQEPVVQESGNA